MATDLAYGDRHDAHRRRPCSVLPPRRGVREGCHSDRRRLVPITMARKTNEPGRDDAEDGSFWNGDGTSGDGD